MNDEEIQILAKQAETSFSEGIAQYKLGQYKNSINHWKFALDAYTKLIELGYRQYRVKAANIEANLGAALQRLGLIAEASRTYRHALGIYLKIIDDGDKKVLINKISTEIDLGSVLRQQGELSESIIIYENILNQLKNITSSNHLKYRTLVARASLNLANSLQDQGNLPKAISTYEDALEEYNSMVAAGHKQYCVDIIKIEMNLGRALISAGNLSDAISTHIRVLKDLHRLAKEGHDQYYPDIANTEMSLGLAFFKQGHLDDAISAYSRANNIYHDLIDAGNTKYYINTANLETNIGNTFLAKDNPIRAEEAYKNALSIYKNSNISNNHNFISRIAATEANLGTSLRKQGKFPSALSAYRSSIENYLDLLNTGHAQYRGDAAKVGVSLGRLLEKTGNSTGAIRIYRDSIAAFHELISDGNNQWLADAANTEVILGNALSSEDNLPETINTIKSALEKFIELHNQGKLQYLVNIHQALSLCNKYSLWQLQLRLLLAEEINGSLLKNIRSSISRWISHYLLPYRTKKSIFAKQENSSLDGTPLEPQVSSTMIYMQCQNNYLSKQDTQSDLNRLNVLESAFETLDVWCSEYTKSLQTLNIVNSTVRELASTTLSACHRLLIEGNPAFVIQRYESLLAPLLHKLLALMAAQGWVQHIAGWYFTTQGLRTQRQALLQAQTDDPEIAQLLNVYQQLDSLLHQMLGTMGADSNPGDSDCDTGFARAQGLASNGQRIANLQAKYDAVLRQQFKPLKESLQTQGKYPETLPLDLDKARTCLARQALPTQILILIPLGKYQKRELLLVRIGAKAAEDALWRVPVNAGLIQLSANWQGLERYARLQARTARGVASWRDANLKDAAPKIGGEEVVSADDAVDLLTQCLDFPKLLLPFLQPIAAAGIQCVHILPAGDAHLAPWAATLDQAIPGLSVRQFPSAGGWWRAMEGTEETGSPAAPTAWASLAYDAAGTPLELRWVAPESRAVQSIWQAASVQMLDPLAPNWPTDSNRDAAPVTALACIGHGQALEGNLALAGLALPKTGTQGGERLFTAMQLHQIRHAERLVMSCCVLGRIEDAQGEPLGMTALAFSFKTRFAVGAMLPIPDFAGSLFFMALHHAWAKAERAALSAGEHMDWAKVFHATRRCIMQGNWPLDYGDWLRTEWLRLLHELRQEDHTLNTERLRWLDMQHQNGEEAFVEEQAQAPSEEVRWVAAVTSCLG